MMLSNLYRRLVAYTEKGLFVPTAGEHFLGAPMQEVDSEEYFKIQQRRRSVFIQKLLDFFPMKESAFISIGAGFGGEEYLLINKTKRLVLIEPSAVCYDFLKYKFQGNAEVSPKPMQNYTSYEKFDIIYASSPSNWMHRHPIRGIPIDFKKFVDKYLGTKGVFFVRMYGGLHTRQIVGEKVLFNRVIQTLGPQFKLVSAYFNYPEHQSLLVIIRKDFLLEKNFEEYLHSLTECEGPLMVWNDKYIGPSSFSILKKISLLLRLCIYVPFKLFRELMRSLKNILLDISTNLRMN